MFECYSFFPDFLGQNKIDLHWILLLSSLGCDSLCLLHRKQYIGTMDHTLPIDNLQLHLAIEFSIELLLKGWRRSIGKYTRITRNALHPMQLTAKPEAALDAMHSEVMRVYFPILQAIPSAITLLYKIGIHKHLSRNGVNFKKILVL